MQHPIETIILFSLMGLSRCVPAGEEPLTWVTSGYEGFSQGTFAAGGDNLYVSRNGRLQMIRVWDVNHDGWPEIIFCNHNTGGNHHTLSRIHWNRNGLFTDDDVTLLPTIGPHGSIKPDLGNAYTRKLEETYDSTPFERPNDRRYQDIRWAAECRFGSSVVFQIRSAATRGELERASWAGPGGPDSYFEVSGSSLAALPGEHRWIQYRAILRSACGAASPVLTRVEVRY